MRICVATKNGNKLHEIKLVLPSFVELAIEDLDIDVEEDGDTFIENSVIKAIEYGKHLDEPVVADDSGLSIDALDGFPGVMSARYMDGHNYVEKMESILTLLKNSDDRSAKFICAATYFNPKTKFLLSIEGYVHGSIAHEIRGNLGFGYDPIFIPDGYNQTFGELGEEVKRAISHRSNAFKKLFDLLLKTGEIG